MANSLEEGAIKGLRIIARFFMPRLTRDDKRFFFGERFFVFFYKLDGKTKLFRDFAKKIKVFCHLCRSFSSEELLPNKSMELKSSFIGGGI